MGPNARKLATEVREGRPPQGAPFGWVEQCAVTVVGTGGAADGNNLATVNWRGTAVQAAYLASYAPTVGHQVAVLNQNGALLILGRIIGTPPS